MSDGVAVRRGRAGIDYVPQFDATGYPSKIAGEVKGFDPLDHMDRRDARRMSRFSQFAVAAGRQALEAAELELEQEDRSRGGVILGNGIGGLPNIEAAVHTIREKGGMRIDPFFMPKMLPNMAAAHLSMVLGAKGYSNTVITACAAGTQAMGDSLDLIRAGRADVVLTGGTEAALCELGLCGFAVIRALSTRNDEPERASRPFGADRDGFGDGEGAIRAMQWALEDAVAPRKQLHYINPHPTPTEVHQVTQSPSIKRVFGE